MLEEAYGNVGVSFKGGYRYAASDTFTLKYDQQTAYLPPINMAEIAEKYP